MDSDPNRSGAPPHRTWHLCWQAAVGREFFPSDSLRSRIRQRLVDAHRLQGRVLIAFCMLPSEIHLIAQLPEDGGPRALARAVGNVVARWVRQAHPVRSPVLAGPFRAYPLGSTVELIDDVRMLAWRPVIQGLCQGPAQHVDGSLRIALGLRQLPGFNPRPLLDLFGATAPAARRVLRACIARRPTEAECRRWELARGLVLAASAVGPREHAMQAVKNPGAAALIAAAGEGGVDGALRLLADWVTACLGGRGAVDLQAGTDSRAARGRALVARIACRHGVCSAASVARFFGRAKATLSEQVMASRRRAADRDIVQLPVERILSDLRDLTARGLVRHRSA